MMNWLVPGVWNATWKPLEVCSAPIGVQAPNCPAVTGEPTYFSTCPEPPATGFMEKLLPFCTRLVLPNDSMMGVDGGGVVGTPITPSWLRSWWKLLSACSSVVLVPETTPVLLW